METRHLMLGVAGVFDGRGKKNVGSQRTPRNAVFEGHPVEKLHRDEGPAVFADVVDRADVGMVERRRGVGFTLKAGERQPRYA